MSSPRILGKTRQKSTSATMILPLTAENLAAHDKSQRERRMFGCSSCSKIWYQQVLPYKPVSKCHSCKQSYNAIPIHEEPKGLGRFLCFSCKHRWTSYPAVRDIPQPCLKCGQEEIFTEFVIPDDENGRARLRKGPRVSNYRHQCVACKNLIDGKCPVNSRRGKRSSEQHESTGSTVSLGSNYDRAILSERSVAEYVGRLYPHEFQTM